MVPDNGTLPSLRGSEEPSRGEGEPQVDAGKPAGGSGSEEPLSSGAISASERRSHDAGEPVSAGAVVSWTSSGLDAQLGAETSSKSAVAG